MQNHLILFTLKLTSASLTSVTCQSCTGQDRRHLIFLCPFDPSFKALNLQYSKSMNPSNVIMLVGGWTAIIGKIPHRRQTQFVKLWSAMPEMAKIPGIPQESWGKQRTRVQVKSTLLFSSVLLQAGHGHHRRTKYGHGINSHCFVSGSVLRRETIQVGSDIHVRLFIQYTKINSQTLRTPRTFAQILKKFNSS